MDYHEITDRLERRYAYVMRFTGRVFLLELYAFVEDLFTEDHWDPIIASFLDGYHRTTAILDERSAADRIVLKASLRRLLNLAPRLRAELKPTPRRDSPSREDLLADYQRHQITLLFIRDTIERHAQVPRRESIGTRDFLDLPEDRAYEMLLSRLLDLDESSKESDAYNALLLEIYNAKEERGHVTRHIRLREPTQAYSPLKELLDVYSALNPNPLRASSLQELFALKMDVHLGDAEWQNNLRKVAFDGEALRPDTEAQLRQDVTRLCHHLQAGITRHRTWDDLVQRYRRRSQWYDRTRLSNLSNGHPREDALSDDLARFMFDNGVEVLVRHSFGGHTPDLVGPPHAEFLVEAKAYTTATRSYLVSGMSQLISYIQTLGGSKYSTQTGYYVIFRLDGPVYMFPEKIQVGPIIVHPILIDIGPGGGRARRHIDPVTEGEVLAALGSRQPAS